MKIKSFPELTIDDITTHPIWRFTNRSTHDDLEISVVSDRPCADLSGAIVGTRVSLADGSRAWALLQNIHANSQDLNEHFLTLTLHAHGQWFSLARYHDIDVADNGPHALVSYLNMDFANVFPIVYDIREVVGFTAPGLVGSVSHEPRIRLTRAELIRLALSR